MKLVNPYVPLQFITGDVEGGDQRCSRYSYYGSNCQRMCRPCDVSTEDAARVDNICNCIKVADIQSLIADCDKAQ